MNEKTRVVVMEDTVDIYHGNEYIGWVEGRVTRLSMEQDLLLVHVKRDGQCTGLLVADTIEKGDQ